MSDYKDRMLEAYERGECSYAGAYDYVRESYADRADMERKRMREDGNLKSEIQKLETSSSCEVGGDGDAKDRPPA